MVLTLARVIILTLVLVFATTPASADPTVEIVRDRSGVPHVYGTDARTLFYGAGYALAEDRLAQWELARRSARGRLAEIFGPEKLEADRAARLRDHTDAEWRQIVSRLPPFHQSVLRAYRDGLNRYIGEAIRDPRRKLPYEFAQWRIRPEPWSMADLAATIAQSIVYYGSGAHSLELGNLAFLDDLRGRYTDEEARRIFDDVLPLSDADAVPVVRQGSSSRSALFKGPGGSTITDAIRAGADRLAAADNARRIAFGATVSASRSVVIGPQRSATGHVLMLQSTADGPDIHLVGAGFDTGGWTFPACPVPIMGRGPTFGWLVTTGEEDMVDLFEEQFRVSNPLQYRFRNTWRTAEVRESTIRVRGATPVHLRVKRTVHGPIVVEDEAAHRAFAERNALWNRELDTLVALIDLSRAHRLEEVAQAVGQVNASFNVQYGGEDGTVAYWHAGATPIRARGVDPRLPTPGTGEFEWRGQTSFEAWPSTLNPPEGYLHVWNNKARSDSTYGEASRYGATFRTYLGRQLVESSPSIDLARLREINETIGRSGAGVDLAITSPKFFTPFLRAAAAGDPELTDLVERMEQWDGVYRDRDNDGVYDDPGLTVFRKWNEVAQHSLVEPTIGAWWHRIDDDKYIKYRTELLYRIVAGAAVRTPLQHAWLPDSDRTNRLRETLHETRLALAEQFHSQDPESWRTAVYWKYLDESEKGRHPDRATFPDDADDHTRTAAHLGLQPTMIVHNGSELWNATMEISRDTRGFDDVSPSGGQNQFIDQRGHGNVHIADQLELHRDFGFKHFPMARNEVLSSSESVRRLPVPHQ